MPDEIRGLVDGLVTIGQIAGVMIVVGIALIVANIVGQSPAPKKK